jgi:hypothetical protein
MDVYYSLVEPVVRNLMCRIHKSGYEICIHPSYNIYIDAEQLKREFENLRRVLDEEDIQQEKRWKTTLLALGNTNNHA